MKSFLIAVCLLLFVYPSIGQEEIFNRASSLKSSGAFDEAYEVYKEASDYYYANDDLANYAESHLQMIDCQLQNGQSFQAKSLAENTLEFVQNELPEEYLYKARGLSLLGLSYLNLGRNDDALESLLKATELFPEENSEAKADCLDALGQVYVNNENKQLATQYLEQAFRMRRNLFGAQSVEVGNSYNNLGQAYIKDDPLQAIIYFNRAKSIYENQLGNSSRRALRSKINIAYSFMEQGEYEDALTILEEVKLVYQNEYGAENTDVAITQSIIGKVYELDEKYDQALLEQNKTLQLYINIYGEKHPEVANTYFLIGEIYQEKSEFKLAAEFYQSSIYANFPDQNPVDLYSLPELKNYFNGDFLLSSLQAKAIALEALHYEKTLNVKDLVGSIETYIKCDELITMIRRKRLNEHDKLRLGEIAKDVYKNGIQLSLTLSEQSLNRKKYLQQAFEFCERSKSSVLLEAITESKAKDFAGIPHEQILLEDSLKDEISYLEQKLAIAEASEEQELKDLLFTYQNRYREFINNLESNYPAYYNLKYSKSIARISDVQEKLNARSALISYFVGDENIYIFTITQKKAKAETRPRLENFEKLITGMRNAIKYNIKSAFLKSAKELYAQLVPNIASDIQEIIVLPDGALGTIPFEAFVDPNDESEEYAQTKFLIKEYHVSYDYSATLFTQRTMDEDLTNPEILLMAPVSFQNNEISMSTLQDSETEINEIKFLFLGNECKPTVQMRVDASESNFKNENLDRYKYLHFATHGLVNESEPSLSRIFLTPGENEDGSLYTGEIYNLNINADLVTLSACETGLGKMTKGEGIVGLSRALQYAGANNIIVSLWQVADASTAQMMIEFYKYNLHNDHHGYNTALRQAKLMLLNSEEYSRPYYWAPFILIGI